jgi:glycosyltransferase involved in cell wall biosynthesis
MIDISLIFVDKIFGDYRFPFFSELHKSGIEIRCLETQTGKIFHFYNGSMHETKFSKVSFLAKFLIILKQGNLCVITGNLGFNTAICVWFANSRRTKIFAWCRLTIWSERNRSFAKKVFRSILLKQVDTILVNGESGRIYCENLGAFRVETFYQSSVVSQSDFPLTPQLSQIPPFKLIFVGRLIALKGLKEFLIGAKDFRSHFSLTVIGEGPQLDELEKLSRSLDLDVRFLGNLPRTEVLSEMSRSDALVMPSLGDEWGLVIVEAMSVGLPILGSIRTGAVEELSRIQEIGVTFDPLLPTSIERALKEILFWEKNRLRECGLANFNLIQRLQITQDGMAKRLMNIIQESFQ